MQSLGEALGAISPRSLVATTHPLDGHADHAALGSFVQLLEGALAEPHAVAYAVIHAHTRKDFAHSDCWYPAPPAIACPCMDGDCARADPGWVTALQRHRLRLDWPAALPDDTDYGHERQLCLPAAMLAGESPTKLRAIRAYGSQLGTSARNGAHPAALDGILDCNGYLISFARRSEAFVLMDPRAPHG
jgi:LmbE family N-acetylglucosaminyl deacetylase